MDKAMVVGVEQDGQVVYADPEIHGVIRLTLSVNIPPSDFQPAREKKLTVYCRGWRIKVEASAEAACIRAANPKLILEGTFTPYPQPI